MKYKIPVAILSTAIIGGGLYMNFKEPPVPVEEKKVIETKPVQGFGVIDIEQITAKHKDGELLKELLAREERLNLELDALMLPYKPPKLSEPPKIDEKPFNDSAYEKNMQNIISQMAELKAERKRLTEKYRRESHEEYLRRRDEVRDGYLNRALNITLKLQNADNLRLSEEEIRKLQIELDELVIERNNKQREMLEQWTAEINAKVESEIQPRELQLRADSHADLEKLQAEAAQKISETQERNKNLMETAAKEIEARKMRRKEILDELTEVEKERTELENKILDSIVDEAGKLGAMYRLEAVLIKRDIEAGKKIFNITEKMQFKLPEKKSLGAMIYSGKDTPDLTKDLIKAVELKNPTNKE